LNFKHFINNIEVEEPEGFSDFQQEIIRDEDERFIRYNFPLDLLFVGDGYQLIENQYQTNYNSELEYMVIKIDGNIESIQVRSIIKISNCEFNISAKPKPTVSVQIDDNVFQSKIFNNKSRPSSVTSVTSINGVAIDPVVPIDLTMFNEVTGVDVAQTRRVYDMFDSLRHTIEFISDNQLTLVSSWYDELPDDERLAITTGSEIRLPLTVNQIQPPVVTFEELYEELWKKYNLYFIVEDVLTDSPILRLEKESYLYGSETAIVLNGVDNLFRNLNFDKLYNRVTVGSNADKEFGIAFPMFYTPLLAFASETFNISGVIGVDNQLDLKSEYIIDSNEIHKTLLDLTTSNDDELFIIQYDQTTKIATKGEYFPSGNTANRFYNEQLLNVNVIQRFNFLGDVVLGLSNLENEFRVSQTVDYTGQMTFYNEFPDDNINFTTLPLGYNFGDDSTPPNFNDGGSFDLIYDRFTADTSGVYRFNFEYSFFAAGITGTNYKLKPEMIFRKNNAVDILPTQIRVVRFDSSNQPYSFFNISQNEEINGLGLNERYLFSTSYTIELAAGDYVDFPATVSGTAISENVAILYIASAGVSSSPLSPLAGGVYETGDPELYYVGVYTINEDALTQAQWDEINNNPINRILIDTGENDVRISYLSKISRNIVSGESSIETIFNRNQTFK